MYEYHSKILLKLSFNNFHKKCTFCAEIFKHVILPVIYLYILRLLVCIIPLHRYHKTSPKQHLMIFQINHTCQSIFENKHFCFHTFLYR